MKCNNKGETSVALVAVLVVLGIALLFGVSLVFGYIGFGNEANRFENGITAAYSNNQNVYDNGWKTVMEKAQVPNQYAKQLKELYTDTMTGRYGPSGSKALLQFIKEENPKLDPSIYVQIQQSVEIFHNQFTQAQTELVSRKQEYQNLYTGTMHGRFYNLIAHYPHIDMSKYDIVTSEKTQQDFGTKKAPKLELF
jgi:type II secretory pathway pseudopilin PulG